MIRNFYWLVLFIGCLGLPKLAWAHTSKKTSSTHTQDTSKSEVALAPAATSCEDWQLPSFVANSRTPSSLAPAFPTSSHKKTAASDLDKPVIVPPKREEVASKTKIQPSLPSAKMLASVSTSKHPLSAMAAPTFKKDDSQPSSKKSSLSNAVAQAAISGAREARKDFGAMRNGITRLARLTAYWAGEGDYYTGRCLSSTGIHLHGGHCAVDPSIIPYGSVVEIPGLGQFLAVDTGSAVVSREAAKEAGHNREERGALVIDLFFEHPSEGERFAAAGAKFVSISWWTPSSTENEAKQARSVFAEEDWNKINSKQL